MARRSSPSLRTVLTDVLVTALAGSAVACGGATNDPIGNGSSSSSSGGGETPAPYCSNPSIRDLPYNVTPGVASDYLEWRTEQAFTNYESDASSDDFKRTSEILSGAPCAKAKDKTGCTRKLADLRVLPADRQTCFSNYGSWGMGCQARYFVYTVGDEVRTAVTKDEIRAFLAPIDTPEEALWALRTLGGIDDACGSRAAPDSTIRKVDGGYEIVLQKNCDKNGRVYTVVVDRDGGVTEIKQEPLPAGVSTPCAMAGRRPEGFHPAALPSSNGIGEYFASMAELEAVSVVAFRRLHRELARLGAPKRLLRRLRSAARDEIRHTRTTRDLARRFGASIAKPCVSPQKALRSAFEIALENAREGCVRETFGALLAAHQALRAEDPVVRQAMRVVAAEETDHAALSWDLARWLERRLSKAQRQAVREAREEALRELGLEIKRPIDPEIASVAGLPSVELSTVLLDESMRQLLAA